VFAIAQLLGEMPYSVLCAIMYWVLMVNPVYALSRRGLTVLP
jgi:ATP-binding cassette, subfamily G (WHITE), member 2, SNQ2